MKNIIYTLFLVFGFSINSVSAQDITFTNTKLDPPSTGQQFGQACFSIIAEEGIELTAFPMAVEVSLSKVNFDVNGISGFNSQKFDWEIDEFSGNVIRGTLVSSVPSVENGGGGAQICIPVNRDFASDYEDTRNGFLVNLIPGEIDQNGNTSNDHISRFGFSSSSSSSVVSNGDQGPNFQSPSNNTTTRSEELGTSGFKVYPNPSSDAITVNTKFGNETKTLSIYNNMGQVQYSKKDFTGSTRIDVQEWTEGMYFVELRNHGGDVVKSEKLVISK